MGCCLDRTTIDSYFINNNKKIKNVVINQNNSYKIRTRNSIPKLLKLTTNSTDILPLYTHQYCSLSKENVKTDFDRELEKMEKYID